MTEKPKYPDRFGHDPNRLWQITLTEEQLCLLINSVEDINRFLCGQCDLHYATAFIKDSKAYSKASDMLRRMERLVVPELRPNASYGWNGGGCPDPDKRRAIALGYALYRELRHRLALHCAEVCGDTDRMNVYLGETLTCGVPLPKAEPLNPEQDEKKTQRTAD